MVTPRAAFAAIYRQPNMASCRNVGLWTYSKALKLISGWWDLGKVRRLGLSPIPWMCRVSTMFAGLKRP